MLCIYNKKIEDSLFVALFMAFIGGYLDVYTYVARGKVFANTQTGNLVLLGLNIAEGNLKKIIYYILPVLFFMLGVGISEIVEHKYQKKKGFLWQHIILGMEIILLSLVMFLPGGSFDVIANILISFVCGLQVQMFRKVNEIPYASTMFTGNVKNAAERITNFTITKNKEALKTSIVYCGIIAMFVSGAFVGSFVTKMYQVKAIGMVDVILGLLFLILYLKENKVEKKT